MRPLYIYIIYTVSIYSKYIQKEKKQITVKKRKKFNQYPNFKKLP